MLGDESWALRLAPEPFRDFLPYVSARALKVIHPTQVARAAIAVAQHVSNPVARDLHALHLRQSLENSGLASRVLVATEPHTPFSPRALSQGERRLMGERVLDLYFHLLRWEGPWFLDLRPRHFSWDAAAERLIFSPSTLWYQPEPAFVQRVRSLYVGFYRNDPVALQVGIELYRWKCQPAAGFEQRIERLLRSHFGPGDASETCFSVAHFRETFDAIFKEVAESRAKLHSDLTFLGVELVGLYLTLESLGVPLNPRRAFEGQPAISGS